MGIDKIEIQRRRKFSFEEIFSNKKQVKLLIILASTSRRKSDPIKGAISKGEIKKRLRVSYPTLEKYLKVLQTSGLIQGIKSSDKEYYRLDFESDKGKILLKLIDLFD